MRYIKLEISNIKPTKLLSKAKFILAAMTDNLSFPNPTPSLAEFEAAVSEFQSTIRMAASGLKVGILLRDQEQEKLKVLIRQMGNYVSLVGHGDGSILIQSGFALQNERKPVDNVSRPIHFRAVRSRHEGSVKLSWKAVVAARMYEVSITRADPSVKANWKSILKTPNVRVIKENLIPGQYYWFRVKAYGRKGESDWSDPSMVMAA